MQGSAGVPPFSHHMDALKGAVSICFFLLSVIYPNSSSVFFGLLFLSSSLERFPLCIVQSNPVLLTCMCLSEIACVFV